MSGGLVSSIFPPIAKARWMGHPRICATPLQIQIQGSLHCPFYYAQGPVELTCIWGLGQQFQR